jgi:phosphohistidine swiveling domain-containing protein
MPDRRLSDSSSMARPPAAVTARRLDSDEVDAMLKGRTIVSSDADITSWGGSLTLRLDDGNVVTVELGEEVYAHTGESGAL